MRHRSILSLLVLTSLTTMGCVADEHEAPFAIYAADGKVTEGSCADTGLLAAPEEVNMRVSIRLVGGTGLHWDHGDGIMMGVVDAEKSFTVSRYLRVDVEQPTEDNASPCAIERRLTVEGRLEGFPDVDGTYASFEATMRNDYQAFDETACADYLEGDEPLAEELPCAVSYAVEGERD
jgi:hypothetical protein